MQPITIAGVILIFGMLFLKYKTRPVTAKPSSTRQRFKTGKLLLSALLVLMAIGFALRRLDRNLDGDNPEPSLMERIVVFLQR
jgi:hypothetical protein